MTVIGMQYTLTGKDSGGAHDSRHLIIEVGPDACKVRNPAGQEFYIPRKLADEIAEFPSYEELEAAYLDKAATLDVNRINHREFIRDGFRYRCGWSSERDESYEGPKKWYDPAYKVIGWGVYAVEPEAVPTPH